MYSIDELAEYDVSTLIQDGHANDNTSGETCSYVITVGASNIVHFGVGIESGSATGMGSTSGTDLVVIDGTASNNIRNLVAAKDTTTDGTVSWTTSCYWGSVAREYADGATGSHASGPTISPGSGAIVIAGLGPTASVSSGGINIEVPTGPWR